MNTHSLQTDVIIVALLALMVVGVTSRSHHKQSDGVKQHGRHKNIKNGRVGTNNDTEMYTTWSTWSNCYSRCTQKRTRQCQDPMVCEDATQRETRACDFGSCWSRRASTVRRGISRHLQDMVFNLLYNEWSDWSMCTRSCKQRRFRTCAMPNWCKNVMLMEDKKCSYPDTKCESVWGQESELIDPEELDDMEDQDFLPVNPLEGKKKRVATEPPAEPLNPLTCGKRPSAPSLRIVGGYESRPGSWPWQVAITTKKGEQYCGGVLVAPQWVLTAAHCVRKNGQKRRISVRVGDYDLGEVEGSEIDMKVSTDFPHPDFNLETIDSDLAIVKLKDPVPEHYDFACIPEPDDVLTDNTLCYAVGWGKVKETHRFGTNVLREAPVPLVNEQKCQNAFEYAITRTQMCAGYKRGGIDTCAGDSGGPLMCEVIKNGVSRWYAYGITSFGEGCGDKGKYGIYTRLSLFHDWIKSTTSTG